jgi:hypothetical protein
VEGLIAMMDDIKIGKGEHGYSAIHVFRIKGDHNISENRVSFWVHNLILGLEIVVMKETKEGKRLQAMVDAQKPLSQILNYLDTLVIRHVKTEILKKKIRQSNKESFKLGMETKAKQLRKMLGCEESVYYTPYEQMIYGE